MQQGTVRIQCPSDGGGDLQLQLPIQGGVAGLRRMVEQSFSTALPGQDYVLTDTQKDFISDEDVAQLRDGAALMVVSKGNRALARPARERISFVPHPKTMTAAGDYEYFAAQGRHPFVYALAEFIDNSLRATRKNAPRPRSIDVSLVVSGANPATARGLVCIADNGCGMSKQDLNEWAVMNYSMEERGKAVLEPEVAARGGAQAGVGRFLTGDLSYFGVGSKNAAFFMGSSIKVVTKRAEEAYVHELGLAADVLEQRYRNQEAVYEEEMVHRNPGDASTLSPMEQPFAVSQSWVQQEEQAVAAGHGSFTRVIIGALKPEVLRLIMEDSEGTHICQELAHLYHYYLHGEEGNRAAREGPREGRLPNGEPFPDICLHYLQDARTVWSKKLAEVDDDMETRFLRAQKAELTFTLDVPGKGTVCGVLHYYPYENDRETVPVESTASAKPMASPLRGLTQVGPSQMPRGTQHGPRMTQQAPKGEGAGGDSDEEDAADVVPWSAPIFEAFWQGRLIPGARIETLGFMEAVRQKRTAQTKDLVPDEAFRRLRGALFFGPAFHVTRNKLLFRDNLQELLATAVPGDRSLERKFKEWLGRCHATLDKTIRFEGLLDSKAQASLRSKLGEGTTAFERITDGARVVCRGDVVRINVKPLLVGRVTAFTIPQVVHGDGCYPNGRVHVEVLPPEVHGEGCCRDFSLRRIEGVLGEKELKEHVGKELLKVPSCLRLEPMKLATGKQLEFVAGDILPETSISVLNGAGQRMTRGQFGGERGTVAVTQRLWRLLEGGEEEPQAALGNEADEEAVRPNKRARKGRKGKGQKGAARQQDENVDPAAQGKSGGGGGSQQELVLEVENKTPNKECFQFARVADGLQRAGQYALEYTVAPAPPGQEPLSLVVRLLVRAGPPASLSLSGEGKAMAAIKELSLGEELPPLRLAVRDAYGNPVLLDSEAAAEPLPNLTVFAAVPDDNGQLAPCAELVVTAQQGVEGSCIVLSGVQVLGCDEARQSKQGLPIFSGAACPTGPTAPQAQLPESQQAVPSAQITLCIQADRQQQQQQQQQGEPEFGQEVLPIRIRPGAPQYLRLLPGHPWGSEQGMEVEGDQALPALDLQGGQQLPQFQVAACDSWGNPTAPGEGLSFALGVDCPCASPASLECQFNGLGVAMVEGLVAQHASGSQHLRLHLNCRPSRATAEAAVAAAQPQQELRLPVRVQPSALPASIQIMLNDEMLPMREVMGEDGNTMMAVVEGIAGAPLEGIKMILLDASGAPAAQSVSGRITASWRKGHKKFTWTGEPFRIPAISNTPKKVNEPTCEWIRFTCDAPQALALEAGLEVRVAPAAPKCWRAALDERNNQTHSQNERREPRVRCGEPFVLEIEALDEFENRCPGGVARRIPTPLVSVEAGGVPLAAAEQEWEAGWVTQGGEEVYSVRMALAGALGTLAIHVRDEGGPEGGSLLEAERLDVELVAGVPAALRFDGAESGAPLACGLRGVLHQVCVRVVDSAGNPTAGASGSLEVCLAASALATDGSGGAAAVSAQGGNKAKAKSGSDGCWVAVFKDVRVSAEAAGTYALRAQSTSRKIAVADGTLALALAPQNVVAGVEVQVPEELREGVEAGGAAQLHVAVYTEDGRPLPAEVAASGLTLKLTPPGAKTATVLALPASDSEGAGAGGSEEGGVFVFPLEDLTAAGTYTAVAEYGESRAALLAGLSKKDATQRSSTVQFQVLPGQPVTLSLEAPGLRDRLAATNGQSAKQRLLIQSAAVQLRDAYANAAGCAGVQVRFRLRSQQQSGGGGGDGEVPRLDGEGEAVRETDEQGRAFFGHLLLTQGSGRAGASGSLECQLVCEALGLYTSASHELETDEEGWALCWACPLLFSDDAARYAALEQLSSRRAELVAERDQLQGRVRQAQQAADAAAKEQQRLAKSATSKAKALPGGPAGSAAEARERAAQLEQQLEKAEEAAAAPVRPAKYGGPRQAFTHAINTILQSGDEGLVGVVARLATIDDEPLARIMSAQYRSLLTVVVVEDMACRERLVRLLVQHKLPTPDVMALSQTLPYRGPIEGDIPGFSGAGALAKRLIQAACSGTDKPIPMQLPHARVLAASKERGGGAGQHDLGQDQWPEGCLGYAYNLVRPVARGQRTGILHGLLGGTLVFETLKTAAAYREFMTQKLRSGLSDIICLDGGRISGRGIVSGSSFKVDPLDKTDFCFGGTPHGQSPALAEAAAELEALREWAELAEAAEQAAQHAEQARSAAEGVQEEVEGQVALLEGELAELDAQLGQQEQGQGGGGGAGGRQRGGRRQREERGSKSPAVAAGGGGEGAGGEEEEGADGGGRGKRRRTQRNR